MGVVCVYKKCYNLETCSSLGGYGVGKVVKVLSYKSVGRLSDPNWCHRYFLLAQIPSERTTALGSTLTLTETSTRSIS